MPKNIDTSPKQETAVLIGVITLSQDENTVKEYLDELSFLLETAGGKELKRFTQKLERPHPNTFVGQGKIDEFSHFVKENEVDVAVFDDELSPSQLRNIEKILKCKILDRNNLILDIFARRAKTAQSKTQVELAQLQYMLPRLSRMWTHLERQQGGIGMRGPGETEIETDRRIIRNKITLLKEKLKTIDKQNQVQRKNRKNLVRVALVGYTNVGKSTLMNLLSKSDMFAENKLFATLDTTVRKVVIENLPFLLSDTVGFIRKLPHALVESFKSTLDEVREADILLHVVDISHPNFEEQIQVVKQTLEDIHASDKPIFVVFNKIDIYSHIEKDPFDLTPATKQNLTIEDLKNSWMAKDNTSSIFISAKNKQNINDLKKMIYDKAKEIHCKRYPYENLLYHMPE